MSEYPVRMVTYETLLQATIDARKARGWSQTEFGRRLGVGQSAVGNWESGRNQLSIERLLSIGTLFGWSFTWLASDPAKDRYVASLVLAANDLDADRLKHLLTIVQSASSIDGDVLEAMARMAGGYVVASERTA